MRGVTRCPAWVVRYEIWVGPGTAPSDRPGAAMVQTPHLSPPLPPFTASATLARRRPGPLVWLLARLTVGPPTPHDRIRIYCRHVRLKLVILADILKMVKHGARFLVVVDHEITHVRAIHLVQRRKIRRVAAHKREKRVGAIIARREAFSKSAENQLLREFGTGSEDTNLADAI